MVLEMSHLGGDVVAARVDGAVVGLTLHKNQVIIRKG